jgi:hypothetical protein
MKIHSLLSLAAAILFAGCAGGHFGSNVKNVGVNSTPQRGVVVLAPDKANLFGSMAREHNGWLQEQLRASINRELSQSTRFQPVKGTSGEGQIVFNSLRHGLLEVSPNNYAAQVIADISLVTSNGKTIGNREITSMAGELHSLFDFEDPKTYEDALTNASDKLALELVNDL